MTNAEFIDYIIVTKGLDINENIETIKKHGDYIGDKYIKLSKLGLSDEKIVQLLSLSIECFKYGTFTFINSLIVHYIKYKYYIDSDLDKYNSIIVRQLINVDENTHWSTFLNHHKLIVNPKRLKINDKVYKPRIDTTPTGSYTAVEVYNWFLELDSEIKVDMIICKDNKYEFVKFKSGDQVGNLNFKLRQNKDFDLAIIPYQSTNSEENPLKQRIDKILNGVCR